MSMPLIIRLTCVFSSDERKEMEKLVNQNGGTYSAELNKKCTHLVCDISYNDLLRDIRLYFEFIYISILYTIIICVIQLLVIMFTKALSSMFNVLSSIASVCLHVISLVAIPCLNFHPQEMGLCLAYQSIYISNFLKKFKWLTGKY